MTHGAVISPRPENKRQGNNTLFHANSSQIFCAFFAVNPLAMFHEMKKRRTLLQQHWSPAPKTISPPPGPSAG
jgi:hypothetical protein